MIIKNIKNTTSDRKYFETKGALATAANAGKLGKAWFNYNPKKGVFELKPHKIYNRI